MTTTWIVVANAARARIWRRTSRVVRLREVGDYVHPASRQSGAELGAERPRQAHRGQGQAAPGGTGFEPRTDVHRKEHERFARGREPSWFGRLPRVGGAAASYPLKNRQTNGAWTRQLQVCDTLLKHVGRRSPLGRVVPEHPEAEEEGMVSNEDQGEQRKARKRQAPFTGLVALSMMLGAGPVLAQSGLDMPANLTLRDVPTTLWYRAVK